jgi:hypothetical protein
VGGCCLKGKAPTCSVSLQGWRRRGAIYKNQATVKPTMTIRLHT